MFSSVRGIIRAKTQPKADQPQIVWLSQARKERLVVISTEGRNPS
jgi:hypothetical protein